MHIQRINYVFLMHSVVSTYFGIVQLYVLNINTCCRGMFVQCTHSGSVACSFSIRQILYLFCFHADLPVPVEHSLVLNKQVEQSEQTAVAPYLGCREKLIFLCFIKGLRRHKKIIPVESFNSSKRFERQKLHNRTLGNVPAGLLLDI